MRAWVHLPPDPKAPLNSAPLLSRRFPRLEPRSRPQVPLCQESQTGVTHITFAVNKSVQRPLNASKLGSY